MNLKKHLVLVVTALSIFGALTAEAYLVPGQPAPGRPAPYPDDRPGRPGNPPPPPIPGRPGDGYGRLEQKTVYLNRRYANQSIPLRQVLGIDERFRGYTVESVQVDTRGGSRDSALHLEVNNSIEESAYNPRGRVELRPRFGSVIGQDVRTLQLQVRGVVDIDVITVNLREGRDSNVGREITLPLSVSRRLLGNDRLDITRSIDMNRYYGYRIVAVEVQANAVNRAATLDLMINGFSQNQVLNLDGAIRTYVISPRDAVLGQSASSLVFTSRGDLDVRSVTLRLRR